MVNKEEAFTSKPMDGKCCVRKLASTFYKKKL